MSKILAYPWQHGEYEDARFETALERVQFCKQRIDEAALHGMDSVKQAWTSELFNHVPSLIERIKELETALRTIMHLPTKYTMALQNGMVSQSDADMALFDARQEASGIAGEALAGGDS